MMMMCKMNAKDDAAIEWVNGNTENDIKRSIQV